MAGFQVANFSFGKNIKDDERQKAIAAMNAATTRRGQDMQAAQADANREENARQFDERQASIEAARAEGARQFDAQMDERAAHRAEGARQFDETQAQKKREYADRRGDVERAQSWDDALKMQQMERDEQELENRRLAFDERNAKLDSYLRIKEEEDAQAERRNALMESSYGNMAVLAQLQNGTVTKKQVDAFNNELLEGGMIDKGREYNYIGTIDQTTGQPFADGKLHFVRYALDGNGQVQPDPKTGRPLVEIDNPLDTDIRNAMLSSYFGDVKEFMGSGRGGGMSPERMQLERDKIYMRDKELAARKEQAAARLKAMKQKLTASIARNFNQTRRGAGMTEEEAGQYQTGIKNVLMDMIGLINDGVSGGEESPQSFSGGEVQEGGVKTTKGRPAGGGVGVEKRKEGGKTYVYRTLKDGRKFRAPEDSNLNDRSSWEEVK